MKIGIPDGYTPPVEFLQSVSGGVTSNAAIPVNNDIYKNRTFQWMGGNNIGYTEVVDRTLNIGGKQVVMFKSGVQMPVEEFNRMLKPVDGNDQNNISLPSTPPLTEEAKALVDQLKLEQGVKVQQTQSKQQINNDVDELGYSKSQAVSSQVVKAKVNLNPVEEILAKRKENIIALNLEVLIDAPKSVLFNMLAEDFDVAKEEIIEYILNNKNIENIKKQVAEMLLKFYNEEQL